MGGDPAWMVVRALELAVEISEHHSKQDLLESDEVILERAKKFKEFLSA